MLAACNQTSKVEALAADAVPTYRLCKAPALPKGVELQMQLDTARGKQLELKLMIRNTAEEALAIDPNLAALITEDQRRQQPFQIESAPQSLAPGEERLFSWIFQPINDLYLYQHSGLFGPLQQQYRLPLAFLAGVKDTVVFCFPEEAYLQYSRKEARNKPILYSPSPASITPHAAASQESYRASIILSEVAADQQGSAHFPDQEFFSGGVNVRHALYQQGDSLYLKLHIINHAPYLIALKPAQITISAQGQPQSPARITEPAKATVGSYQIRKGDRLSFTMAYKAPAKADSLLLSLDGIELAPVQKPLFEKGFYFIKQ